MAQSTRAIGKMISKMGMVYFISKMVIDMKVTLRILKEQAKVSITMLLGTNTKENIEEIKEVALEFFILIKEINMQENSQMD